MTIDDATDKILQDLPKKEEPVKKKPAKKKRRKGPVTARLPREVRVTLDLLKGKHEMYHQGKSAYNEDRFQEEYHSMEWYATNADSIFESGADEVKFTITEKDRATKKKNNYREITYAKVSDEGRCGTYALGDPELFSKREIIYELRVSKLDYPFETVKIPRDVFNKGKTKAIRKGRRKK
jgi:hypothetical protein